MNKIEAALKILVIQNYGSMKKFADKIQMPWTTLDSILKRGIANSNISNVLKITRELGIDAEKLVDGEICAVAKEHTPDSWIDKTKYTREELKEIQDFAEFLKVKKSNQPVTPPLSGKMRLTDVA